MSARGAIKYTDSSIAMTCVPQGDRMERVRENMYAGVRVHVLASAKCCAPLGIFTGRCSAALQHVCPCASHATVAVGPLVAATRARARNE